MLTITLIIFILSLGLGQASISPIQYTRLAAIAFLFAAILAFNVLYMEFYGTGLGLFSGLYQVSTITQSIETFLYVIASLILIPWFIAPVTVRNSTVGNVHNNYITGPRLAEYPLILLFSVVGASLLISSSDLISMYLSIELQSFAVYILAAIHRDSESATAAGLKYFLLGGLSSCFILLGAGLIYASTGLTNIESIFNLVAASTSTNLGIGNITMTDIGFIFIIVGFLFKIAAAPLHNWAPDVYDEVPNIVTTWLTIMPKISIVIFLLIVARSSIFPVTLTEFTTSTNIAFENLFIISAALSLIIGSVVGLAQYKIKRLLAYSTISHVGFLLLALAINTSPATESLIFYLVQYSITNLNTFLILLALGYAIKTTAGSNSPMGGPKVLLPMAGGNTASLNSNSWDLRFISELRGAALQNPLLTISLALCLFSMAGIPPLIGFFAKQQVLYAASASGYYAMTIIAILVSVISASYYLQIIKIMHFSITQDNYKIKGTDSSSNPDLKIGGGVLNRNISTVHSMLISILTLGIVLFILDPDILLNSTHLLALTIFQT